MLAVGVEPKLFDFIVVGQGLAGTALAWTLQQQNKRVLVIDAAEPITSSRIAAGLMTPITGRRFVQSWRYAEFWSTAVEFYQSIERATGTSFFRQVPHLTLFQTQEQQQFYSLRRLHDSAYQPFVRMPLDVVDHGLFRADYGGIELLQAGQLMTGRYLQVSRERWAAEGLFLQAEIQPEDLQLSPEAIAIPRLGVQANHLILCQGAITRDWPWFQPVRFQPAKGEILTLSAEVDWNIPVHRGLWLSPADPGTFRAGATYEWNQLDHQPTAAGRMELMEKLKAWVQFPFDVVDHQAAVRPALFDQKPVIGLHPQMPSLGLFNGLGSKGSLQSPWLAEHFAAHLCDLQPLDPAVDVQNPERFPGDWTV